MGKIKAAVPVKLFVGMLSTQESLFTELCARLQERFGAPDSESPVIPFIYTDFYNGELGEGILRKFYSFEKLTDPLFLADAKLATNDLEEEYGISGKRRINLDPGYISLSKLVLASAKDRSHRIYIGKGIYAEVTLQYEKKAFQGWHWTYSDYESRPYQEYLLAVRKIYARQLREEGIF